MPSLKDASTMEEVIRATAAKVIERATEQLNHEVAEAVHGAKAVAETLVQLGTGHDSVLLKEASVALVEDIEVPNSGYSGTSAINQLELHTSDGRSYHFNRSPSMIVPPGKYRMIFFLVPLKG